LRAWYLFERFLGKLDAVHLTPLSSQLLASFTDLLPIRVTIKSGGGVVDSDSESESETDLVFDNQLYLFQAAGLLMARGANLQVGEALIQELCNGITERLTVVPSAVDQELLGYIHHSMMWRKDLKAVLLHKKDLYNRLELNYLLPQVKSFLKHWKDSKIQATYAMRYVLSEEKTNCVDSICFCETGECYG